MTLEEHSLKEYNELLHEEEQLVFYEGCGYYVLATEQDNKLVIVIPKEENHDGSVMDYFIRGMISALKHERNR